MADSKISALPASTTPLAGTEVLPIVQSSTTKQVSVANLTAGRTFDALGMTLTSTDAGANEAPTLDLYRDSATPAASDTLGEIQFNGEDSAGNKQKYACIHGSILSPTSGSEQGQIHFETQTAGASTEKMIIGTTNLVINEIGAVFNVRIEGDADANLFYTDATNDRVGVGTASPAVKLDVAGAISSTGAITSGGVVTGAGLVSTVNGTQLTLQRAGPAAINTMSCGGSGELVMSNSSSNAIVLYNTFAFFPSAATTASGANAFIDNGSAGYANQLLRSTSSAKYKTNVEDLQANFSKKIYDLRPIWYRSAADADRKDWSWYGLIAEEVAAVEPRLVHWTYADDQYEYVSADVEGSDQQRRALKSDAVKTPDGIQYDRIGVLLLKELQTLRTEFDAYVAAHP
jgi:hypothetical protein